MKKFNEIMIGGMRRFWILVILLIIFFGFVAFVVYPGQEGMISSTELQNSRI